jgi:hypothetical protein
MKFMFFATFVLMVAGTYRYPDDPFDHYWYPQQSNSAAAMTTTPPMQTLTGPAGLDLPAYPPRAVSNTAVTTNGNVTITFPLTCSSTWYLLLYCIELDPAANATSREFYVTTISDYPFLIINPFFHSNWSVSLEETWRYSLELYQDSTTSTPLGPLVNAIEIYEISQDPKALLTNDLDGELCILL